MEARTFWTSTRAGTVALFEPNKLAFEEYFSEELYTCLTYIRDGQLILFGIGGDGAVGMSIETVDALPDGDSSSATGGRRTGHSFVGRFECDTGKVYFGPAEALPCDGSPFAPENFDGEWVAIPPGKYVYRLSALATDDPEEPSLSLLLSPVTTFDGTDYPKNQIPNVEA